MTAKKKSKKQSGKTSAKKGSPSKSKKPASAKSEKANSVSASPPDPFEAWREWLDRAERQWNSAFNQAMESELFVEGSSRVADLLLAFQGSMSEATHRYFSLLNVPTRSDVLEIGERLSRIEERLAALEGALVPVATSRRTTGQRAAVASKPKRTRRPPAAADDAGA